MKPLVLRPDFTPFSLSLPIFQSQPNPHTQNLSPSLNLHTPFSILNELYLWHPLRIGWHSIGQSKCRLLRLLALVEPQRFYGVECSWSILLSSLLVLCKQTITIIIIIIIIIIMIKVYYNYHKNYPWIHWGNFSQKLYITILYVEEWQTTKRWYLHKISSHVTSRVVTSSVTWLLPN